MPRRGWPKRQGARNCGHLGQLRGRTHRTLEQKPARKRDFLRGERRDSNLLPPDQKPVALRCRWVRFGSTEPNSPGVGCRAARGAVDPPPCATTTTPRPPRPRPRASRSERARHLRAHRPTPERHRSRVTAALRRRGQAEPPHQRQRAYKSWRRALPRQVLCPLPAAQLVRVIDRQIGRHPKRHELRAANRDQVFALAERLEVHRAGSIG